MENRGELFNVIDRGIYLLRGFRHEYLYQFVEHAPSENKYHDHYGTDENIRRISKAIKHLKKARAIVEGLND